MTPQETIAHLQSQLNECRRERDSLKEQIVKPLKVYRLEDRVKELEAQVGDLQKALEAVQAAFKHWEGEPVSTGHYDQLIYAKEAVNAALAATSARAVPSAGNEERT